MIFPFPNHVNPYLNNLKIGLKTAKTEQLVGMRFMHFDNQNWRLKIHGFCHFLTNSMAISGLENKKHFFFFTLWEH